MIYIFDTNAFITLFENYYQNRFPSLWEKYDKLISDCRILSVREVKNEIHDRNERLTDWIKVNAHVFHTPLIKELEFIRKIFSDVPHFQNTVRKTELLKGTPVADPFVIAKAKTTNTACVVSEEIFKDNAAKIPNICNHFKVNCTNLDGFMGMENWTF